MWIGVVLSVIIVAMWFITVIEPVQFETDRVQRDLNDLSIALTNACNSLEYEKRYNPVTEEGSLHFNASHTCINTSLFRCKPNLCAVEASTHNLTDITTIVIQKYDTLFVVDDSAYTGSTV